MHDPSGRAVTEMSFQYDTGDKLNPVMLAPLLSPNQQASDISGIVHDEPSDAAFDSAMQWAESRRTQGKDAFARPGEGGRSRESILAPLLYRKK
jgi:hypothetical protein